MGRNNLGGAHVKIDPKIESILNKALAGKEINREEAVELVKINEHSYEMYALMSVANTLTRRQFGNKGEIFAQVGINVWPCPRNCGFCSFGADWNVIESRVELSLEEVVERVLIVNRIDPLCANKIDPLENKNNQH